MFNAVYCSSSSKSVLHYRFGLFVGTLMGITNTVATLPGFIGPALVGVLTHNNVSFMNVEVI